MCRSEPEHTIPTTQTLIASRKRRREDWTPPTPTSLPRRKRGREAAGPSAERAIGDGDSTIEEVFLTGPKTGHAHTATTGKSLLPRRALVPEKPLHLGFVLYWDENMIGVHCPFCLSTETHPMQPAINEKGPFTNPIWHQHMRAAVCQPELSFRLLFPYDRLAMSSLGWEWVEERSRWETLGIKGILSTGVDEEGEKSTPEESICLRGRDVGDPVEVDEEGKGATLDEKTSSRDQDFSDHLDVAEDMRAEETIPSEELSPLVAANGADLSITISDGDDDEDEAIADEPILQEHQEMLRLASSLYYKPPPEYLSFSHGQASVIYRPVAVIPVSGAKHKTVGFLAPTEFPARRVFTRSGWRGEEISDGDISWLQGILATPKEAPWQELVILNNREYTDKVRELSGQLGLKPKHHNYDKECPLGQVCFSHVEKQLVVVALEEYQPSTPSRIESPIKRTVYLDRAPCVGCLEFAKAVEQRTPLKFTFIVMARVTSDAQALKKLKEREVGHERAGEETDNEDEMSPDDHRRQGSSSSDTAAINNERYAATMEIEDVYEVSAIVDRRTIDGDLQYLVEWKEMWLNSAQFEAQMRGLYADELQVVCELTGRKGERRRLIRWNKNWMRYEDLYNSRNLVSEFERGRELLG
ncbi:hypothetical protein V492_05982 [Pseudogymnoascus sp. VKM F-4246]|nr:hypothetical protein V492_05982 [Pseudogymnoascus sp. VKM F-4246]